MLSLSLIAQENILKGKVIDFFSRKPIPFVAIQVNDNNIELLTDINGEFNIPNNNIKKLRFKHYPELPLVITLDSVVTKELEIKLFPLIFSNKPDSVHDHSSFEFAKLVINSKTTNSNLPHSYLTYNKFHIDTDEQQTTTQILNSIVKKFSKRRIEWNGGEHHFFLMESLSEKKYFNKNNQKETVYATKVTGLQNTAMFNINSGLQFLSVYNNHLNIASHIHISPLSSRGLKRYDYEVIDTIQTVEQTLVVLKFSPNKRSYFEGLQGLIYINPINLSVQYFQVSPVGQQKSKIEVSQKYQVLGNFNTRMPVITSTSFLTKETTNHKIRLLATIKTYIYKYQDLPKSYRSFDDCVVEYLDSSDYKPDSIWSNSRQETFREKDQNTLLFFKKLGNFKKVDQVINIGRNVYSGLIPLSKINIRLNKLVSYNDFEGLRLGLGLETNEAFNKNYLIGGYYGYGVKDNLEKYGLNASYILHKQTDLQIKTSAQKELNEPGSTDFVYDKQQYSSEPLRKYRIPRMDYIEKYSASLNWAPFKYIKTFGSFQVENINPKYAYKFNNDSLLTYNFNELELGFRYAFGEKTIKYEDKKISLGTRFPIFQLQFTQGLNSVLGNFAYRKLDIKISYDVKLLGYGRHIIQIATGFAEGTLPYMKLYNSKGSFRNFYAVIHNSFETMAFNEFVSDQYSSLFYTVNLGKLNKFKKFRPTLELSQNIGFGTFNSQIKHQYLEYKTMEKGYFESGIILGNLIELHTFGLKTGLGLSFYYRYGPYAFEESNRNLVFKLATNFRI